MLLSLSMELFQAMDFKWPIGVAEQEIVAQIAGPPKVIPVHV